MMLSVLYVIPLRAARRDCSFLSQEVKTQIGSTMRDSQLIKFLFIKT